ncbi:hypothetical protein AMECASPLE_034911 [Ameca splendens]|uniref:Uncharacterized protein n=1 Tax=Ameca splendens TaxID=208324 RepID=A0ABV0XKA7_9TELE
MCCILNLPDVSSGNRLRELEAAKWMICRSNRFNCGSEGHMTCLLTTGHVTGLSNTKPQTDFFSTEQGSDMNRNRNVLNNLFNALNLQEASSTAKTEEQA